MGYPAGFESSIKTLLILLDLLEGALCKSTKAKICNGANTFYCTVKGTGLNGIELNDMQVKTSSEVVPN